MTGRRLLSVGAGGGSLIERVIFRDLSAALPCITNQMAGYFWRPLAIHEPKIFNYAIINL